MLSHTQRGCRKTASTTLRPFPGLLDPQICYESRTASLLAYELSQTRDAFTTTVKRDVSGHTELIFLSARSYRIVHSG
ncbi:hypothetical protein TNCV_2560421 [Trichonephila clavipes]|uniref:Uncharacterized protein n=1 Tax=Trichonephila clavipes TaxID=2585209 RepID=A0A8X6R994_TRICX|nr:hypothetical protein TNCV_2560421 [Trichonephila clavipes]